MPGKTAVNDGAQRVSLDTFPRNTHHLRSSGRSAPTDASELYVHIRDRGDG